ncbi:unnamed protein product [Bursaphelenchus xylophilus]|uniref:(pine wood nematode) hypothetical protein n=1 Tax=Bursaphelenchus xylophilus TaxID=6326 RepID=A0A7I8XL90_BURXY|nr:unnamed protein product [Bursaphelenchus xylophilus]CAG9086220.1 unnamed protein product [Bursaphelenchus xylophilus]
MTSIFPDLIKVVVYIDLRRELSLIRWEASVYKHPFRMSFLIANLLAKKPRDPLPPPSPSASFPFSPISSPYPLDLLPQSPLTLSSPFPSTSFLGMPLVNMFGPLSYLPVFNGEVGMLHQLSHCRRKRRHRTIFTDEQLSVLEQNFALNQYPDMGMREKLAVQCELKEERVEIWFKNRRAKERKKGKEGSTSASGHSPHSEESNHLIHEDSDFEDYESKPMKRGLEEKDEEIQRKRVKTK